MPGTRNARDLQVVDTVLTNVARAFKPEGFIYNEVFPTIGVDLLSGLYPIFDGFFDDDTDSKVSDRAETPEVDFAWSTDSYLCEDYRLKASITRREESQAHAALKLRQNKLDNVLTRMAIRREKRAAALLRKTTNGGALTNGAGVSNKWDTDAATIELDVKSAKLATRTACGLTPNTIIIPYAVGANIAVQQDIREILKYTVNGSEILNQGEYILPSKLWGMDVLIPKAMSNSAKEGNATRSLSDVWSDNVILLHRPGAGGDGQRGGWGIPSTGYSFKAMPEVVDRWRENDPPVEYVRAWETVDEKICAPDFGYEITDVLS